MARTKEERQEEREYYIKLKVCVNCHQEDAEPNKRMCFDCAEKNSEQKRTQYASMTPEAKEDYLAKKSAERKERRKEREANGLCVGCGKRLPYNNTKSCYDCLKKSREKLKKHRKKKAKCSIPIDLRNGCGLCRYCGNPLAKETDKLCPKCHDKISEVSQEINANPTPAMLKTREDFVKNGHEFNDTLFYAPQIQKQENRVAIENYERMCKSYI